MSLLCYLSFGIVLGAGLGLGYATSLLCLRAEAGGVVSQVNKISGISKLTYAAELISEIDDLFTYPSCQRCDFGYYREILYHCYGR